MKITPMDDKAYERCELIIRHFMTADKKTPELIACFHEWLLDGVHCKEKYIIMHKLFCEALSGENAISAL